MFNKKPYIGFIIRKSIRTIYLFVFLLAPLSASPQLSFTNRIFINSIDTGNLSTPVLDIKSQPFPLPSAKNFNDYAVYGKVTFGYDLELPTAIYSSLNYGIVYFVEWQDKNQNTEFFEDTLYLSLDTAANSTVIDKSFRLWENPYYIKVYFSQLLGSSGHPVYLSTAPAPLYLRGEVEITRQYNFNPALSPEITAAYSQGECEINLSLTPLDGVSFYELEWLYVNDYANSDNPSDVIPPSQLFYTFRDKAMRVRLNDIHYPLPAVFRGGYIIFRTRGVQQSLLKPQEFLYGAWSLPDNYNTSTRRGINAISALTDNVHYVYIPHSSAYENSLNYYYTLQLSEDGKQFQTIAFYDGLTKQRQQVTHLSSEEVALVTETIYDHAGREAITTLPAPVKDGCLLKYYSQFNLDSVTLQKYSYPHFENKFSSACLPVPNPFAHSTGAGKYYSPGNPFQNIPAHQYVPDAVGYPFLLKAYTPDNTGRIISGGMAGRTLMTGFGHETKYMYGTPAQEELDRLFGTDAGYRSFYRKNFTVDPNGQTTVQYLDVTGKQMATALAGPPPAGFTPLNDNIDSPLYKQGKHISTVFINTFSSPPLNEDNRMPDDSASLLFSTGFVNPELSPYTLRYRFNGEIFTDACIPDDCYDCIYNASLSLIDGCGNEYIPPTWRKRTLGDTAWSDTLAATTCNISSDTANIELDTLLPVRDFILTKNVMLNDSAMEYYWRQFVKDNNCLLTLDTFITREFEKVDTMECEISCDTCGTSSADTAGTGIGGGAFLQNQNLNDSLCYVSCSVPGDDWCQTGYIMMLNDMSPNGQYGKLPWYMDTTSTWWNGTSVYINYPQALPCFHKLIAGEKCNPYYTNPWMYINGSWKPWYVDENGNRQKIYLSVWNSFKNASPETLDSAKIYFDNTVNKFYTYPENLSLKEFLIRWNPSWAKSLIVYHPEFMYLQYCAENILPDQITIDGKTLNTFEYDEYLMNTTRDDAVTKNLLGLLNQDPFFKTGGGGAANIHHDYQIPYQWYELPLCTVENWVPYQKLSDEMNDYASGENIWRVAWITTHCSPLVLTNINDLIDNDSTWRSLVRLYMGIKHDIMLRAAHAYADGNNGLNVCIGDDDFNPFDTWELPEPYCNPEPFWLNHFTVYPGMNRENICSGIKRFFLEDKIKRFGTTQEILSFSEAYSLDTLIKNLQNRAGYKYFQLTGKCPFSASFELMLELIAGRNKLTALTPLNQCDALTPGLCSFFGLPFQACSLQWNPSVDATGKILTANLDPETCEVTLRLPDSSAFTWNDTVVSLYNLCNIYFDDTVVHFDVTAMFKDTALHNVSVSGTTCLRIDTCAFQPECALNTGVTEIVAMLNYLASVDSLTRENTPLNHIAPAFIKVQLGYDGDYVWNKSTQDYKKWKISNASNGNYLEVSFNKSLALLAGGGVFTKIQSTTNSSEGCSDDFILTYIDSNLNPTHLWGTMKFGNGEYLPVRCCKLPSVCDEGDIQYNAQALLDLLKSMINITGPGTGAYTPPRFNFSDDQSFNNLNFHYPLTKYLPGLHNIRIFPGKISNNFDSYTAYIYRLTCDSSGYFVDNPPINWDVDNCTRDTLCSITLWDRNGEPVNWRGIMNFILLKPLATEMLADGITYRFKLVYYFMAKDTTGNTFTGIDTLDGETCIPLSYCITCDAGGGGATGLPVDTIIFCDTNITVGVTTTQTIIYEGKPVIVTTIVPPDTIISCDTIIMSIRSAREVTNHTPYAWGTDKALLKEKKEISRKQNSVGVIQGKGRIRRGPVFAGNHLPADLGHIKEVYTNEFSLPPQGGAGGGLIDSLLAIDNCFSLCGVQLPPIDTLSWEDPCKHNLYVSALFAAQALYENYMDSVHKAFVEKYKRQCMKVKERLTMRYILNEYHYTLYYYDQSGNLVRTIPPEGVVIYDSALTAQVRQKRWDKQKMTPSHNMTTEYRNNSLNAKIEEKSPDGGLIHHWYDKVGREVASQNAKQKPQNKYSYTRFDALGRPTETGELTAPINKNLNMTTTLQAAQLLNNANYPDNWSANRSEVVHTYYDNKQFTIPNFTQEHLRTRVASATIDEDNNGKYEYATHYSYDIHGNVNTLVQENKELTVTLGSGSQQYKRVEYEYDLLSSKVTSVKYQPGKADAFYHRYEYDADNRLKEVYSGDNASLPPWGGSGGGPDARYFYYLHGPLARVEFGAQQVQGIDYAYTINGWVKGINSNILNSRRDIGMDGETFIPSHNKMFARDVFSYSLHYFNGDYKDVGNIPPINHFIAGGISNFVSLYNGNIGSMITSLPKGKVSGENILKYNFLYDQLNRFIQQNVFKGIDTLANTWGAATAINDYKMLMKYDANGNILKMLRNGTTTGSNLLAMDNLTYNYKPATNQLTSVDDGVSPANYSEDIDDQQPGNYAYDEIGNLNKDNSEGIADITWNVYGKVKTIKRAIGTGNKPELLFNYSADGNRISKEVTDIKTGETIKYYYVRDAQGNIMATYILRNDLLFLEEQVIYGSSRLGVVKENKFLQKKQPVSLSGIQQINIPAIGIGHGTLALPLTGKPGTIINHTLGKKMYELTNWLGNVQVVISDKKLQVDKNNDGIVDYYTADVRGVTDYYPGGMGMPGRSFNPTEYRFGYQGQIKTDEVYGSGNLNSFEFREQDPRVIRFWSVDPLVSSYPGTSSYAFSQNRLIDGIDLEGLEWEPLNEKGKPVAPGASNIADYRWTGWSKIQYVTNENNMSKISNEPLSDKSVPMGVEAPPGTVSSAELQMTDRTKVIYSSDPFKMTGETKTVQTTTIRVNRYYESNKQTLSTFEISGTGVKGVFTEPPGPSTVVSGQNRRIPAGNYNVYKHWREWHEGWYGLSNQDVGQWRRILMHHGEDYTWTEGCLVCEDKATVRNINKEIKNVGIKNTRVIINEKY